MSGATGKTAIAYNAPASTAGHAGMFFQPWNGTKPEISMFVASNQFWSDTFPAPSAATWHHYCFVQDRSARINTAYVDGTLQTLTTILHAGATYGTLASTTRQLELGTFNAGSFLGGRLAEVAVWRGISLTASEAKALASGGTPYTVHPDNLGFYSPLLGDSPEPDYSGNRNSVVLTGTTVSNHPVTQTMMGVKNRYLLSGGSAFFTRTIPTAITSSIALIKQDKKLVLPSGSTNSFLINQARKGLVPSQTTIGSINKNNSKIFSLIQGSTNLIIKQLQKSLIILQLCSILLNKKIARLISVPANIVTTILSLKAHFQLISVIQSSSVTLNKSILKKILGLVNGLSSINKSVSKIFSVISITSLLLSKNMFKAISYTELLSLIVIPQRAKSIIISITQPAIIFLSRLTIKQLLARIVVIGFIIVPRSLTNSLVVIPLRMIGFNFKSGIRKIIRVFD